MSDLQWMEALDRVKEYCVRNDGLPRFSAGDPAQTALAKWLARRRCDLASGMLAPERLRMLDETAPGWRNQGHPSWLERLEELRRFHEKHGRMPSLRSNHRTEVALYYWLRGQRRQNASGTLPDNRLALLDQHLPGWAVTRGLRTAAGQPEWMKNFQLVLDYCNAHGAIPTAAKGVSPERKRMGAWLNGQRALARRGSLQPERKRLLDDAFPGWNMARAEREAIKWKQQLADVAAFKARHGVIPRDDKLEANEHALRAWLARQRKLHAEGKLPADQLEAINAVDADWLANGTRLIWENNFTVAVLHLGGAGSDTEAVERAERWLETQRSRARRLSEDQLQALDDAFPGWQNNRLRSWQQRLRKVASDLADGELSLADEKWLRGLRNRSLRGKVSEEMAGMLDEAIPRWRTTTAGGWAWDADLHRTAANLASGSLTVKDIRWLSRQRTNHLQGLLTPDKVCALDGLIPEWAVTKPATWNWRTSLTQVAANLADGNLSPEDSRWLADHRAGLAYRRLAPWKVQELDERIPSWRSANLLEQENRERAAA